MALTIRPEKDEQKLLNKLCDITNNKAASKALMVAAEFYVNDRTKLKQSLSDLQEKNDELKYELEAIKELLTSLEDAKKAVQEFISPKQAKKGRG